jgi:YVTN family beta-propeller protein
MRTDEIVTCKSFKSLLFFLFFNGIWHDHNNYAKFDYVSVSILSIFVLIQLMLFPSYGLSTNTLSRFVIVDIGTNASSVAVNPETNMIYVSNLDSGTVSVINGSTNSIASTVNVGDGPTSIAVNPKTNTIYLLCYDNSRLCVLDGNDKSIKILTDKNYISADDLAIDSKTNSIFVTNFYSNTVSMTNGTTNKVSSTVNVGDGPTSIALNPKTNSIYTINPGSNTLSVIGGEIFNRTIPSKLYESGINVDKTPIGVAVNEKTNTIYVTNADSNTVSVIDGGTNKVSSTLEVGHRPLGITTNQETNTIYVTNADSNTVSVIDGDNNNVTSTVDVGQSPISVAVNPETNTIYVTNSGSNTVSVIDGDINNVTTNIGTQRSPTGIAVNPETNTIYVTNFGSTHGSVSVIDGEVDNLTSTIMVGQLPVGIAVNPLTNTIYAINSDSNTVSVIGGELNNVISTIAVGKDPRYVAVNPKTNTIYVTNSELDNIMLIDTQLMKVLLPRISLNVNPLNAATMKCNNQAVFTNSPIRLPFDSSCNVEANQGFKFTSWTENIGPNATKAINSSTPASITSSLLETLGFKFDDKASIFSANRPGIYTANFKEIPPPIPKEYLIGLYTIVVTTIVGLAIPSIVKWIKTKGEIRKLNYYHKKINSLYDDGKLDNDDLEALDRLKINISDDYSKGRINGEHYSNLKDEVSALYQQIYNKRIESLDNLSAEKEKIKTMKVIKEDIADAFAKSKLNELHYTLLKEAVSEKE